MDPPRHRLHHQRGVGDSARGRRDIGLVAEGILHLAVRDHAVALLDPDHAVAGRGNSGRAAAVGRDRQRRDATRHCHRRTAAGTTAGAFGAPGIAGAAEQRRIGQALAAKLRRRGLADQYSALRTKPATATASWSGTLSRYGTAPKVVRTPLVLTMSFTVKGCRAAGRAVHRP